MDEFNPDFIFYLSGVDVLENDKLGRLSLTINGCKERDRFILSKGHACLAYYASLYEKKII